MSEKMTRALAATLGVLAAIGVVLLITMISDDGNAPLTAPSTSSTTVATTTTLATTTTIADTTTEATTTTAAPTTTEAPFAGDLSDKTCETGGFPAAGTITDIRFAQHEGFTRIVFDFDGEVPACFVTQQDPSTISVLVFAVAGDPPFAADLFDETGTLVVGTVSVVAVSNGGAGGGSGEWTFTITTLSPDRPFSIVTLGDPSRLAIDIGD